MKKKAKKAPELETVTERLKKTFENPSYTVLTKGALYGKCKFSKEEVKEAEAVLRKMEKESLIVYKHPHFHIAKKEKPKGEPFKGIFRANPRGFGFVISDNPKRFPEDAFIAKNFLGGAVDGDTVEVEVFEERKKDKGPEGKIIRIIQRGRSRFAALVHFIEPSGVVNLYSPLLGPKKMIRSAVPFKGTLSYGDRVIVKIVDWGDKHMPVLCEIEQVLGSIADASIDVIAATEEFQIATKFPLSVIKQAKAYGKAVKEKDLIGRVDLTGTETFTIDPTTAKDFDDALSLSKSKDGHYHLMVHIADVAHYVTEGSPLDEEASARSNSTYFPGACIPMLPEELSNNLCSLKPNVKRLCVSVFMTFDEKGDLLRHEVKRSVIKSAKRFTYEEAKQVLDGKKKSKHLPTLELMVELCLLLKQKRNQRGSIDFSLPEVVLELNAEGQPESFKLIEYDITHQLVEEYMLKANEIVAESLINRKIPLIFRIHEEPSSESKEDFFTLARLLGFSLPPKPTSQEVQKLFEHAKTTPYAQQLSISFIRSMKLAIYSSENIGHYGLALEKYCHFTSPIRRYPDLVVQRLLFDGQKDKDLAPVAQRCSDKERVSFKAEQSVKTLKKLRLLQKWFEEDNQRQYVCQVTKIRPFSLGFELSPVGIEGSLHVSEIKGDYFVYEEEKNRFLGKRTGITFGVGDTVTMRLLSVDLVLLEAKWERALEGSSEEPKKNKNKKRRR